MYRVLASLIRPFIVVIAKLDWQGEEHLQQPGGYIVTANHVTNLDPLTTAHFLYVRGTAPKIMAKSSLWKVPVLGWFLRGTKMIPVYRGTANAADALSAAGTALDENACVLIFPEGTLTKEPDLWPMAAKSGAARLALTKKVPVVPVAQWGTHKILRAGKKLPKFFPRSPVAVHAGAPVDLSDLYDQPLTGAILAEATERIMTAITELLEPIRGEKAPEQRFNLRRTSTDNDTTTETPSSKESA